MDNKEGSYSGVTFVYLVFILLVLIDESIRNDLHIWHRNYDQRMAYLSPIFIQNESVPQKVDCGEYFFFGYQTKCWERTNWVTFSGL